MMKYDVHQKLLFGRPLPRNREAWIRDTAKGITALPIEVRPIFTLREKELSDDQRV